MRQSQPNILIVEDNDTVREGVQRVIERMGYKVSTAPGGAEGIALYGEKEFDLVTQRR